MQQFRTTGRTEVPFAAAHARRELIMVLVVVVLFFGLGIWTVPDSISTVRDSGASAGLRLTSWALLVVYAVLVVLVPTMLVLMIRRLRGSSPGVVLSTEGVHAARSAFFGFRPVVPWPAITWIELVRNARGENVVTVVSGAKKTLLPVGLALDPEGLRHLLEGARQHSFNAPQ